MAQIFTKVGLRQDMLNVATGGWLRSLQDFEFMGNYHYTDYGQYAEPESNDAMMLVRYRGKLRWDGPSGPQYYLVDFFEVPQMTVRVMEGGVEHFYLFTYLKYQLGGGWHYGAHWTVRPLPGPSWYDAEVGIVWPPVVNGFPTAYCPQIKETIDPESGGTGPLKPYPPIGAEAHWFDDCQCPDIPAPVEPPVSAGSVSGGSVGRPDPFPAVADGDRLPVVDSPGGEG